MSEAKGPYSLSNNGWLSLEHVLYPPDHYGVYTLCNVANTAYAAGVLAERERAMRFGC